MSKQESERNHDWQAFLLIAVIASVATSPLFLWGPSCGHDFDFHLVSWMEALHSWHTGILYPHWTTSPNYGAGEPRFVFYPPLTWMLGGILGAVFPWTWAPHVFTLLILFACGLSMHALAREWLAQDAAILAACLYIVNPYTLFNAYERTAYGELMSGIWLPLIVLFALRRHGSSLWLAIALAAIWLTNAPGAVMGEYLLVAIAVLAALLERAWWPLVRAAWGQVLGIGLASFYVLPAAYERRWVSIAEAIGPGMRVEDSWLFGHTGEVFHDQVLRTASWIAVTLFLLALAGAGLAWRRMTLENRRWLLPTMVLLPLIFFLLLPSSDLLWQHLPEMKFLQFPWRWLLIVSMAAAVLLGSALKSSFAPGFRWLLLPFLAIAAVSASLQDLHLFQSCDEEDAVPAQVGVFRSGAGVEGTDEYAPLGADNTAIQRRLPKVRILTDDQGDAAEENVENPPWSGQANGIKAQVKVETWQPEYKRIEVASDQSGYAVLQLRDYPAWGVLVEEKALAARPHRPDGLMTIPIRAGSTHIVVRWKTTSDVLAARWISGFSVVAFLGTALWSRKPGAGHDSPTTLRA